ncbi:MAG: TPM domain-containing protein [Bacteroidia bacterium]
MLGQFFNKKPLTKKEEERIISAIAKAESLTSGEIRVHFDSKKVNDPVKKAEEVFNSIGMTATKEQNGILFYINIRDKAFAIVGDKGIHDKVTQDFWNAISNTVISKIKQGELVVGLEESIILCGEKLKKYFPIQSDDKNELPNSISY